MAYVVAATWRARQGEQEHVAEALRQMTPLSRAEPGCLVYQAHRSPGDPTVFFLYERYVDEAAFEHHKATAHYAELVKGVAIPLLEARQPAFYETLDPTAPGTPDGPG